MSKQFEPRFARTILAVSIAAIGAAAQSFAWAEDAEDDIARLIRPDSTIELGLGRVSGATYKSGDYTGLQRDGVYTIGNVELNRRSEDGAGYVELQGRSLGLDSRNVRVEAGEHGNYAVRVEYDQIPKLISDSYQTPFTNPGSTNLTLPSNWVRGATTTNMTTLNSSLRPFNIDTQRNATSLGFAKQLPAGWDFDVRVKREEKDGNRLIGAVIGNSGGNPRAAILPEPVNYTTDEIEAIARYTADKLQMQFGYYGSFFRNANNGLAWANPFASSVWVGPTAPGVTAFNNGQLGLPPDNQFHQFNLSAGYSYTKDTRVSGSLSLGRMTQDDAFLPYSINSALLNTPLPRSSLDGRIDTTHADLKVTSKLMPKLNMTAAYRYDQRDNKTPQATYAYVGGDSQTQGALDKIRINLPGSTTRQQVDADFDYHMAAHTKLRFGAGYDWAKKTYEAITDEREGTLKAEVHHEFNDTVNAGFGYAYSDRKTSDYNAGAPFVATFTPAYLATQVATGLWDNVPTQKKFFLAPRVRDKVRAFVNVSPTERVDLQFGADFKNDDYHESQYGLQKARGWSLNFDVNVVATDALSGHLFTSLDSYSTLQRSIALGAAKTNVTNTGLDWSADIGDRTTTAGAGFRYKPLRKYEFGGDLSYALSRGKIGVFTGPAIAAASQATPMPDLTTRLVRLDLFGQYKLQKDVTLKMKYLFERFRSTDWAVDGVLPATLANVIGTNQVSPRYSVHVIGVSVAYQF
jgi:MtrB/PioB family decaheme-associated outer membrane protein